MRFARLILAGLVGLSVWGAAIDPNVGVNLSGPAGVTWSTIRNQGPGGLMIQDATYGSQGDAFDYAGRMVVGGTPYVATNPSDLTGGLYSGGVAAIGNWNVSLQYYADSTLPVIRAIGTFTNTGSGLQNVDVQWQNNSGSDSGMVIRGSSSGDTTYTTADRWVITDDSPTAGDPTQVWHLYGGTPGVTPSAISTTVFSAAGTEGIAATYNISANAGQTVSLMWLIGITNTTANGLTLAEQLDGLNRGSSVFSGIGDAQWATIANWNAGAGGIPEPATLLLCATGLAALAFARRRR